MTTPAPNSAELFTESESLLVESLFRAEIKYCNLPHSPPVPDFNYKATITPDSKP